MPFNPDDRVKVTSQNSQYRQKLGTVETVDADGNHVRIDGYPVGKTALLLDAELIATNLPSPVTYPA